MDDRENKLFEAETIITYNQLDKNAVIFTHDSVLQKHMKDVLGIKPHMKNGTAREFTIPKTWLRLPRKPREISSTQREARKLNAAVARRHKSAVVS